MREKKPIKNYKYVNHLDSRPKEINDLLEELGRLNRIFREGSPKESRKAWEEKEKVSKEISDFVKNNREKLK
tara:strand:- start:226 stop:441 length:216 start_codon:yes stop_codon:yes gene_type:complete